MSFAFVLIFQCAHSLALSPRPQVIDEESLLVVRKIENVPAASNNKPKLDVSIEQCGEL
jgi:hypothetical protein